MASAPQPNRTSAADFDRFDVLSRIGSALGRVKSARRLTLLDMADQLGRSDDQLARYIAGDMEMGVVAWELAKEAWPELAERLTESAAEREARRRQRPLDLDQPAKPRAAA